MAQINTIRGFWHKGQCQLASSWNPIQQSGEFLPVEGVTATLTVL
jgi:hypothetical protein